MAPVNGQSFRAFQVKHSRLKGVLLVLIAVGGLLATFPASAVLSPAQRKAVHCIGCHTGNAKHFTNPKTGAKKDVLIDIERKRNADHGDVPCQDCHVRGFDTFPHENVKIKGCMDCHARQDKEGAKEDAPYHFRRIKKEFESTVHFTKTKDKFGKSQDFITSIRFTITKTHKRFPCSQCHHPHYMKTTAELGSPMAILKTQNKWCTSCHAANPKQPINLILGVKWPEVTDPAKPSLVAEHASIPHAALHLHKARCVDCHSGTEHVNSHKILLGDNTPGCNSCHARKSVLSRLYRYVKAGPTNGFTNAPIVKKSYVMGATRYKPLDILAYILVGLTLIAVTAHGLLRLKHRNRSKRYGKRYGDSEGKGDD